MPARPEPTLTCAHPTVVTSSPSRHARRSTPCAQLAAEFDPRSNNPESLVSRRDGRTRLPPNGAPAPRINPWT